MDTGIHGRKTSPLVTTLIVVVFCGVLFMILAPVIIDAPPTRYPTVRCANNLKQQGLAISLYSEDYSGRLPLAPTWCDSVIRYAPDRIRRDRNLTTKLFTCPALPSPERGGYALNSAVSRKELPKVGRSYLITVFETAPGWNLHGGLRDLASPPRHRDGACFLFADGHVVWRLKSRFGTLAWTPSEAKSMKLQHH